MGIKWMIKKSDFYEIKKSVNKEADSKKLEQLKKEVIAILEKKDGQEYKKAIEHFEKDESKYSRLEKSITGEWIEKAGYGVGTVRIWKGKKYKKVSASPVRWVRVFDKNDRGAASSMGKYIAQVKRCNTVEELYQFCMKQRSLFQDENGVDLPIMDKLKAAIESQGNKLENTDKREKISNEYMKEDLAKLKAGKYSFDSFDDFKSEINKQAGNRKGSNQPNYIGYLKLSNDDYLKKLYDSMPKRESKEDNPDYPFKPKTEKERAERAAFEKDRDDFIERMDKIRQNKQKKDSKVLSNGKTVKEIRDQYGIKVDKKEAEKHQNRSDAMKGNQNARKYGLNDNQIEYYGITDVVEDYHGIAIVKNENGYSYVTDGKVNDRPEDFTTLAKAKERANDHYEMIKNIEEAKKVDFKSIKPGKDVEFTGTYNGWNTYVKKSPDGSKSLVAKVKVSEMREPLEFTFEVKTKDRGWQYDTTYGNEDGLEWAVEHPTQMEKQLKDFFKRDVDKEWNKMDSDYVDTGVANIVKTTDASMDNKEPIAKATKVADGKVTIPNDPAVKSQMKQLIASRYTDYVGNTSYGDMLSEVYYDGENLVSTDAKAMKIIKIGKLDGIEPNKYVKIDISGKDNISINQMDKKVGQYPNYKRVIPNGNDQTFAIDNKLAKEKIEAMKRDGSIPKNGYVALEFEGDAIKVDGTIVGKTYGTKFDTDHLPIQADYILNVLGKNGEETNFNASDSSKKAITVTTNVSTDVIMPMVNGGIPDYEQNRKDFKENQEFESARKEAREKEKVEQDAKRLKPESKELLLKNKPEGVSEEDYSSMIDFADDYYVKLGYDNSQQMAGANIKRMIDNAINQINNKDYGFEEMLLNSDNKVSRKIFEMLTGERVGTNKQAAQRAWESWVGKEGVDAHNKKIADAEKAEKDRIAAEKKAKDDAEREKYHGFMDGKTPAGKGKAKDILEKKGNFGGKIMTYQELADKYIADGGHVSMQTYQTNSGKDKNYYYVMNKDGRGYEIPKTIYDYAKYIKDNPVKKSLADIIMLDEYEHEDFDEDYSDFDASQPDLFNSPSYKVSAALDSVFGCR